MGSYSYEASLEREDYDIVKIIDNFDKYNETKVDETFERAWARLKRCGSYTKIVSVCKRCKIPHPKVLFFQAYCGLRYCFDVHCIVERFASMMETFHSIIRLKKVRKLWHFVIGFPPIPVEEFKTNFDKYKKRMEYALNSYWSKLKKYDNVQIQAIRVLDYSFETDGYIYCHYHYGAIPIASNRRREVMLKVQHRRKETIRRGRTILDFHFQSFGYKKKEAIFAYLAKRSAGLYKHDEGKNSKDWNSGQGKLKKDIEGGKYFGLKDILTFKEYVMMFYKKRHYATVGGLPHGSIPTDNIDNELPAKCPFCQNTKDEDGFSIEIEIKATPPPEFLREGRRSGAFWEERRMEDYL